MNRTEWSLLAACAAMGVVSAGLAVAATTWRIDPARTRIAFAIDAVGYPQTQGRFDRFDGRIAIDLARPERSSVVFHVQSASVDVGSASFGDYLRSPAFLDADKHPSIDFVSTSVEKLSDRSVRVSGELTLLGVTRPLTVDVAVERPAGAAQTLAFSARTHIDRLAFGMNSGFPLVSRDVDLTITSAAAQL
ncbi:polyisoprenoid-binding protein YceI [Roseiarcus fermentans]|uniref:Polyisoprenoid-binding protein YceI n=1 Tax=Roseiarcus fermentans TaxID=1473586 RepID=A0A366F3V0_9HYPH|nr:YceI family protein [Roseiarcus fermentans]RBP09274.1 polyisoprenoid-binding protein YceI [Roseiarcus fermentans]